MSESGTLCAGSQSPAWDVYVYAKCMAAGGAGDEDIQAVVHACSVAPAVGGVVVP